MDQTHGVVGEIGHVTDANTGIRLNGAGVTVGSTTTTSATAPAAPGLGDGSYYAFVPAGGQPVTAALGAYQTVTATTTVAADQVSTADLELGAARVQVSSKPITVTARAGTSATAQSTGSLQAAAIPPSNPPASPTWQPLAHFPQWAEGSAAAIDPDTGRVYTVGGQGEYLNGAFSIAPPAVYDPSTDSWHQIAQPGDDVPFQYADAGFVDGKLYATALCNNKDGQCLWSYDPRTSSWAHGPGTPLWRDTAGSAVLDGKFYLIGGCEGVMCGQTDVQVYDPKSGTWTTTTPYPERIWRPACGAIAGKIYCAGGETSTGDPDWGSSPVSDAFAYDPGAGTWSRIASLPATLDSAASTAANGQLLVAGGVLGGPSTNYSTSKAFTYDPGTNAWSALPDDGQAGALAAGACGMYKIGGTKYRGTVGVIQLYLNTDTVQRLSGYNQCNGNTPVPWLSMPTSKFTVPAGRTVTLTLTLAPAASSQRGRETANIVVHQNTPYEFNSITSTLTVQEDGRRSACDAMHAVRRPTRLPAQPGAS